MTGAVEFALATLTVIAAAWAIRGHLTRYRREGSDGWPHLLLSCTWAVVCAAYLWIVVIDRGEGNPWIGVHLIRPALFLTAFGEGLALARYQRRAGG